MTLIVDRRARSAVWAAMTGSLLLLSACVQPNPPSEGPGGDLLSSLERIAYLAHIDGYWQVWLMAPDGSNARQLTRSPYEKAGVDWYPDGRHLLVNALDGRLLRVDAQSGVETEIVVASRPIMDPAVSPDGRRIAFAATLGDNIDTHEIQMVDVSGGQVEILTKMQGFQHEPTWSPDGKSIYFLSGSGGQDHDILQLSVETRSRQQLTVNERYHFGLALSRDGQIAYSTNRGGDYDIFVWNLPAGLAPRQLTKHPGLDDGATWSPRGDAIAFHSTRSGVQNVWRIPAAGGEPAQLTDHPEGARSPAWWGPR